MEKSEEVTTARPGGWPPGSFSPLTTSGGPKSLASPANSLSQILQQNGNINLVSVLEPQPGSPLSLQSSVLS